ncbi:hypothetical protein AQB9606_03953 [Aquabacterium sp. CECT 9606]|nr:hypothetical protein AQB9606_03953 [Aquabacterium sp. CECT 9606]
MNRYSALALLEYARHFMNAKVVSQTYIGVNPDFYNGVLFHRA